MDKELQQKIIDLVRKSIKEHLEEGEYLEVEEEDYPEEIFSEEAGVFVTLKIDGKLRGCIGNITSTITVLNSIIRNSIAAAFKDPRFPELTEEEFQGIKISVSILTQPLEVNYSDTEKFIKFLETEQPGLIIRKGFRQATFLPSVWEEISDPEEFMKSLCKKADLPEDIWKSFKPGLEIESYESTIISE
ncbi:AmmeMemoRadiSam system protein A [Candidatus Dojkabacteria bacterium]|nr:AmmeMemoRadiSam system protein A [Candidatus Dojkabacteria bacterium]